MKEGLDALRMLFYANLLSGQRDTLEIIDTEREKDEKMQIELVNRRQRRSEDAGVNEEQGQNQQSEPSSNETTPQASTTSAAAAGSDRSRNPTTTTNEKDENESPFENALQIKLGLKPNEYRHGQYPFDDFVNEYANEKIEIKKEYLDYIQRPTSTIQFSFIFYPFFLSTINKIGNLNLNS
jgi:hypothetical protein